MELKREIELQVESRDLSKKRKILEREYNTQEQLIIEIVYGPRGQIQTNKTIDYDGDLMTREIIEYENGLSTTLEYHYDNSNRIILKKTIYSDQSFDQEIISFEPGKEIVELINSEGIVQEKHVMFLNSDGLVTRNEFYYDDILEETQDLNYGYNKNLVNKIVAFPNDEKGDQEITFEYNRYKNIIKEELSEIGGELIYSNAYQYEKDFITFVEVIDFNNDPSHYTKEFILDSKENLVEAIYRDKEGLLIHKETNIYNAYNELIQSVSIGISSADNLGTTSDNKQIREFAYEYF